MDYEQLLHKLGSFGVYQKRLLAITFLPVFYNSFGIPISNFPIGDHLHRCRLPGVQNDTYLVQNDAHADLINQTIPTLSDGSYDECHVILNGTTKECSDWVFDKSVFHETVKSQFQLVCERKLLLSHVITLYFFGVVLSVITLSPFSDVIGRRPVCCIALTIQLVANLAQPFSTHIYMFAILRFCDGFAGQVFYQTSFIIGVEMLSSSKRQVAGTGILLVYCFGEFVLVLLAYLIRDWKWLQLTVLIPMILSLIYWWPAVLPESPRWLISRGRYREATVILKKAAHVNKVSLDDDISIISKQQQPDEGILVLLKKLLRSPKLLSRLAIMAGNWFVVSFIYYGIQINVGKFGGDLYLNFLINVIAETVGYAMVFLSYKLGRRRYYLGTMLSLFGICLTTIFTVLFLDNSLNWITVALAMTGKLLVSLAFGVIYLYTGELFPTVMRGIALCVCGLGARIGSLVTPYLYEIAQGKLRKGVPFVLYAGAVIVVTILACTLPETANKRMIERIDDITDENESKNHNVCPSEENKLVTEAAL